MDTILEWVYFEMPPNVKPNMVSAVNTDTFGMVNITADMGLELLGNDVVSVFGWNFSKTVNFNVTPQCFVNWYVANMTATSTNSMLTLVYNALISPTIQNGVSYASSIDWTNEYLTNLGISFVPFASINLANYTNKAGETPIQQYGMTSANLYAMVQSQSATTTQQTTAQQAQALSTATQIQNVQNAAATQAAGTSSIASATLNDVKSYLSSLESDLSNALSSAGKSLSSEFTPLAEVIKYLPYIVLGVGIFAVVVLAVTFYNKPEQVGAYTSRVIESASSAIKGATTVAAAGV